MPTVADLAAALERHAPRAQQADFDNSGLQTGDPDEEVTHVITALDLTPEVIDEAEAKGAELIVTHHPHIFKPLSSVTSRDWHGALVLRLAQAGIAHYAIHTNLDVAPGGVSFALAEQIGLNDIAVLAPESGHLRKLVLFVPLEAADSVRDALGQAGAGRIGAYRDCSFSTQGTGRFRPTESASPTIGTAGGRVEATEEIRIEALVEAWRVDRAVRAAETVHPYEEMAHDVYTVEQPSRVIGYGAVGRLPGAEPLGDFLARLAARLGAGSLRYAGDPRAPVERVAVCGGAGMSFLSAAQNTGAQAYVTADITYHRFFDVLPPCGPPEMALIDAGHYETERVTEDLLVGFLTEAFPEIEAECTDHHTSPVNTFAPEARLT